MVAVLACVLGLSTAALAVGEHGGKERGEAKVTGHEHGGKEHGGTQVAQPSKDDIRATMKDYVLQKEEKEGFFEVMDPDTGKSRKLKLLKVHERVGKTGDYFYSCADFKDTESGEKLDLDLDVENRGGVLNVVAVRIHKLEGSPRYTYDENDNRIPLMETKSHLGAQVSEAAREHAGKEHGGK